MKDLTKCSCKAPVIQIEYGYDHPEHYDGVSEIQCTECKRRWGRWSGNELKDGEWEPVFGGKL